MRQLLQIYFLHPMLTDKADMVANWIKENGNPAIEKLTSINQQTAAKVHIILEEKRISIQTFATLVDIKPEEIDNWLKGKHNFSEKKLSELVAAVS